MNPPTETHSDEKKSDLKRGLAELEQLVDEVRVKLHLAGMDAKDAYHEIAKRAAELGRDVEHATESAVNDLIARLRKLAAQLVSHDDAHREKSD